MACCCHHPGRRSWSRDLRTRLKSNNRKYYGRRDKYQYHDQRHHKRNNSYQHTTRFNHQHIPIKKREKGEGWREWAERQTLLRTLDILAGLESFKASETLHQAVVNKDVSKLYEIRRISGPLNEYNYVDTLRTLLSIDEAHNAIAVRKFDLFDQRFTITRPKEDRGRMILPKLYGIRAEGVLDGQPRLVANDLFIMRNTYTNQYKIFPIQGFKDNLVLLKKKLYFMNRAFLSGGLDIYFASSGMVYSYYESAVTRSLSIKERIFEEGQSGFSHVTISVTESRNSILSAADERLEKLNEPQRQAVVNILKNECYPKPYILFGPPGTGKTHTLVEAVAQIYARSKASVLFCVNSNTCADQITAKLRKVELIESEDIVRLVAGDKTTGICSSRIIVTTNLKSYSLMAYGFDFVFIDEAGHAHEPESLLPICSLKSNGCLVMAGDPKQLGPVVQCEQAAEYGLDKSMFERIFNFKIYKRDRETNRYNEKHITKLLISYRCDERILAISNKLFYEDELECPNATPNSILKIMNISNPLQFCHVNGNEHQPLNLTSWQNDEEADQVVDLIKRLYKMGIEPTQIGVISPYKLQTKLIAQKLKEELKGDLQAMFERRFERIERKRKKKEKNEMEESKPSEASDRMSVFDLNERGEEEEFYLDDQDMKMSDDELDDDKPDDDKYEIVEVGVRRADKWICKIDSVDAFQGNEREIIIISTVRTPSSGRKDFIDEPRRFNVALSRAKWLVFVVGHQDVLDDMFNWSEFMCRCSRESSNWPEQWIEETSFEQKLRLFKEVENRKLTTG